MTVPTAVLMAETHEFSSSANLASDLRMFLRIVRNEATYGGLLEYLAQPGAASEVAGRALQLLWVDIEDDRFEHPHDVAVAVYLQGLADADSVWAPLVAGSINDAHNLWWANQVAAEVGSLRSHSFHLFPELEFEIQDFSFDLPTVEAHYGVAFGPMDFDMFVPFELHSSAGVRSITVEEAALFDPGPGVQSKSRDTEDLALVVGL